MLLRRLGDEHLMIAASVLVCWVSYLLGEALHVSGVIATVTAGLVCGWYQHVIVTASVRLRSIAFWQVLSFLLEAAVFILIGLSLRGVIERVGGRKPIAVDCRIVIERVGGFGVVVDQFALPVGAVVLAVTLARFAWVFGSDALLGVLRRAGWRDAEPLGTPAAIVISWAGMRGVVTLAVALSVPEAMPGRDLMLVTAFGVILATVLIQGMTLGQVIRWAGLREDEQAKPPLDLFAAEAAMLRAQFAAVEREVFAPDGSLLHPRLRGVARRDAT